MYDKFVALWKKYPLRGFVNKSWTKKEIGSQLSRSTKCKHYIEILVNVNWGDTQFLFEVDIVMYETKHRQVHSQGKCLM